MRPCDCKDSRDSQKLKNNWVSSYDGINTVTLEAYAECVNIIMDYCTVTVSNENFKRLAEWYLEDQG